MTLQGLDTYVKLRNEVVRVRHAQIAAAGNPQPMDISAADWGEDLDALGKGRGKNGRGGKKQNRGGGGGYASSSKNCHYCGKSGHYQAECKKRLPDLKAQQSGGAGSTPGGGGGGGGKPKSKAKAKAQPKFKGKCNRCKREGHMAKDLSLIHI